jgi:hypothetical protein
VKLEDFSGIFEDYLDMRACAIFDTTKGLKSGKKGCNESKLVEEHRNSEISADSKRDKL